MKRLLAISALSLAFASPAFAADFSGTWEVGVREFGGTNYYLPVQDGRLVLNQQGNSVTGRFNELTFSGSAEKDGLHLACNDSGRACGQLVLQLTGNQLSGKGEMIARSGRDARKWKVVLRGDRCDKRLCPVTAGRHQAIKTIRHQVPHDLFPVLART